MGALQQQHSPNRSMTDENHLVMKGISKLTLNTYVDELMFLYETIVDFKNLKDNGSIFLKHWNSKDERVSLKG